MESRKTPLIVLVDIAAKMGGVEFSTLYLADKLDREKYRTIVICPEDGELPDECRKRGIEVRIIPLPRFLPTTIEINKRYIPNPFAWTIDTVLLIFTAWRYKRYFREANIDLVCTKGLLAHFYGGIGARLSGKKCVIHMQDLISNRAGGIYATIFRVFTKLFAHHVIADGYPIKQQLTISANSNSITVIHNGVDLDELSPAIDGQAVRTEWNIAPDELLIGNVARLTTWKGQDYLIDAFKLFARKYPKVKLVLVGSPVFASDAFEKRLHNLVKKHELQDRVIFAGYRHDLPQVLSAMDIYVHSSIEKDTSPLAVVSAMASGKPIVSTNVDGVAELFTDQTSAILVETHSAEALAAGLEVLLSDTSLIAQYGNAARKTAENNLSLSKFVERCEAVFTKVIAE